MSKQPFWDKQIVLDCPKCGKGYKHKGAMMAHFSREHDAITHDEQLQLLCEAIDNWKKKYCKEEEELKDEDFGNLDFV